MSLFITSLFGWMPPILVLLCTAVTFFYFFTMVLRIWSFILDLIPFLR